MKFKVLHAFELLPGNTCFVIVDQMELSLFDMLHRFIQSVTPNISTQHQATQCHTHTSSFTSVHVLITHDLFSCFPPPAEVTTLVETINNTLSHLEPKCMSYCFPEEQHIGSSIFQEEEYNQLP